MLNLDSINTYYGDSHVVKDVSLAVEEDEVVGLIGRNGAGKTTILQSISGMVSPRSGTITFAGRKVSDLDISTISKLGIKHVLEDRRPFPDLTVAENLKLSRDTAHGEEWTLDRVYSEFERLQERSNQKAGYLSGGEQQMLVIAQALIGNPLLILLDEPMEGLAPQIVDQISDIIDNIRAEGVSMLLVGQNYDRCLHLIDRGYVLHQGEIVWSGSAAELDESADEVGEYIGIPGEASQD
jgi:branched-chain amino acid transport system ATP-binding protein